jgi:hypothetical protein
MNCSVLVHTFNGYRHLWPGFAEAFKKHWSNDQPFIPIYFGTDIEPENPYPLHAGETILSGPGEWSDRLRSLLSKINTDYVLYIQEDMFLTSGPRMVKMMRIAEEKQLLRLQISPINQFYTLHGSELPLFFHPSSKYLVSHQPSIWRKDFLLSCLKPGESPWVNEYEGTKRLQNKPEIHQKIAIYPYDWYSHKCIKGQVVD